MVRVAAIVEGHGETAAVPILIRRIARELDPGLVPRIDPVLRVPGNRLTRPGELERNVELAAARRAASFDKCYREVVRLLESQRGAEAP